MSFYMRHVEREIISALIDGELSAEERRFVHEHLQSCEACREASEEFMHIHGMVGELPPLVAPESFVSNALRSRKSSRAARVTSWSLSGKKRWVVVGVAAAATVVTLSGLATPSPATEPPVDQFIARHVSIHSGSAAAAEVLFAVRGR